MSKKKTGKHKAILGLIVGLVLGLSIIVLKSYMARELIGLLDDEVRASCDCEFKVDSVSVSLLNLSAHARNARIVSGGVERLSFETLRANFSLADIDKNIIDLLDLYLINGHADGVDEDSPTFKFIDYLSAPSPDGEGQSDRIRLKLLRLHLIDSSFTQAYERSAIDAQSISMDMQRDTEDNFELRPQIKSLSYRLFRVGEPDEVIEIGGVRSFLTIYDSTIKFHSLSTGKDESILTAEATSNTAASNALSGTTKFTINSDDYDFPPWVRFRMFGAGSLEDSLGSPAIQSELSSQEKGFLSFQTESVDLAAFESFQGSLALRVNQGDPELELTDFSASSATAKLTQHGRLHFSDEALEGAFQFSIDELQYDVLTLHAVQGNVKLSGSADAPDIEITIDSATPQLGPYRSEPVRATIATHDDGFHFKLNQNSDQIDSLLAHGVYIPELESLEDVQLTFNEFPLIAADPEGTLNNLFGTLRFTGGAKVKGPIAPLRLAADSDLRISSRHFDGESALLGKLSLHDGKFSFRAYNKSESLDTSFSLDVRDRAKSTFQLSLKDFNPSEYAPGLECIALTLDAKYNYLVSDALHGEGRINLDRFDFGCEPYHAHLVDPVRLTVAKGDILLSGTKFRGSDTDIDVSGTISAIDGYDVRVNGEIRLNSLLGFFPDMDDMRGTIDSALTLTGPLDDPHLEGSARIHDGELAIESSNINGTGIEGDIDITKGVITISSIAGRLNGGEFLLSGTINPLDPSQSDVQLQCSNIFLQPVPNGSATLSGKLELAQNEIGIAGIRGDIVIDAAEFEQNIDLRTLVASISSYLFSPVEKISRAQELPDIEVDLHVNAPRNMFLFTNWVAAELAGELFIRGNLNTPLISGQLHSLSGWFGIRSRRFGITSGNISFAEGDSMPQLDIVGESSLLSPFGDNVQILAEITGPLISPTINLSSDKGLTQKEILRLITLGGVITSDSSFSTLSIDPNETSLFGEDVTVEAFFHRLATIDSIYLEPEFNPLKGEIDPALVATKKITESTDLIGKSFVGSGGQQSQLELAYALTNRTSLSGLVDAATEEDVTALEGNIKYSVLSDTNEFLKIETLGLVRTPESTLLKSLRIGSNSRIPLDDISRLGEQAQRALYDMGFFTATASAHCPQHDEYCRKLVLHINEGMRFTVRTIEINGDQPTDVPIAQSFSDLSTETFASEEYRKHAQQNILRALRSEGYIASRVKAEYKADPVGSTAVLMLTVFAGDPASFTFVGNTAFKPEDFLETINLFKRKQAFGNNTINILIQNMERLYREAGYLYASFSYETLQDSETNRTNYVIKIQEEIKAPVATVQIRGNENLTDDEVNSLIDRFVPGGQETFYHPEYAVSEVLENAAAALRYAYIQQGYPDASVEASIHSHDDNNTVSILYTITEGPRTVARTMIMDGIGETISVPPLPEQPYSIPRANSYLNDLLALLREKGWVNASFSTRIDTESEELQVLFDVGAPSRIGNIRVQGNDRVSDETILSYVNLMTGDLWSEKALAATKRKLLGLRLFSRVDIEPADGTVNDDAEDLVIKVDERPLQNLDLGTGVNSEYGVRIFAEAYDRSLFADGKTLSLKVDTYYEPTDHEVSKGVASLQFATPYVFGSEYNFSQDLRFQKLNISTQEFDLDRISLASYLYRSWESGLSFTLGHTILQEDLSGVTPGAVLSDLDDGIVDLSFLSGSFSYDKRDNPLVPREGWRLSASYKAAFKQIASDASFVLVEGGGSYTYPFSLFGRSFGIANNSRAGSAWTFDDTPEIPITQRFYLGGRNTVRGFRENSLGPRGFDSAILGGDLLLQNNFEFRYFPTESLSVLSFLDSGTVFLGDESVEIGDLRHSTGLGVRYLSPIGPIGLDVGFPLDEKPGEPSMRVHFSIGSTF